MRQTNKHSKIYSKKMDTEDFNFAFNQTQTNSRNSYDLDGGYSNYSTYSSTSLEQSGGSRVDMGTKTVLESAKKNATTKDFYGNFKNAIYMRGEIIGNKLEVNLISVIDVDVSKIKLTDTGKKIKVCDSSTKSSASASSTLYSSFTPFVYWTTNSGHLIEIKDGDNIYTQHHLATAATGGDNYKFCKNPTPGKVLSDSVPILTPTINVSIDPKWSSNPGIVYGADDTTPTVGKPKDFLFVDLTKTEISNGSEHEMDKVDKKPLSSSNMSEQIINFLLHKLVQYKLAKTIFCRYESDKVTKITVKKKETLISYEGYNYIRFANELHNNVFSQCFEYYDKFDKKLKLVHAITQLEPSDSAINMKDCSVQDMNSFCNLTKVLVILNPFTRKLNKEESIFYLALRIHTFDVAIPGNNLIIPQRFDGDFFISGTFSKHDANIDKDKLNDLDKPEKLANCFDYLFGDNGIGRFIVDQNKCNLMLYDLNSKKNVRLVCYNYNDQPDNNMIQPYDRYEERVKNNPVAFLMNSPIIIMDNATYLLTIQTTRGHGTNINNPRFINKYDVTKRAEDALTEQYTFAMHVCTATTAECNSITSLADELNC